MSIALTPPPSANRFATAPNMPPRIPLTRQHYYLLFDAGLIPEKCELIDGEIIEKMPHTGDHVLGIRNTSKTLGRIFGLDRLFSQMPLILGTNDEPEPDVFVTLLADSAYPGGKPSASDAALVVEVSYSTLDYDRGKKANRYALSGVADYWVVDVENRKLFVFRSPTDGFYPAPQELEETQDVTPLAAPNAVIPVKELLP
jgi:Uma2 family endonuclease